MSASTAYSFVVAESEAGKRLDQYLAAKQLPYSRSQVKKHITNGCCAVNGATARPAKRLSTNDDVAYEPPAVAPYHLAPEAIPLSVLYEDSHLIVVDKPAGMVVHPAPGHQAGTLVAALLSHCGDLAGIGGELRPGIVHRLDKLTSGVMVVAKSDPSHRDLAAQFKAHSIERCYLALAAGAVTPAAGSYKTFHRRHPVHRKRFTSRCESGRHAVTHYRVLDHLKGATLLEATLETGRTHQVRVHFADGGHPLLGDPLYGRAPADLTARAAGRQLGRQALHAQRLAFTHPESGQRLSFATPPPADIRQAIDALREND